MIVLHPECSSCSCAEVWLLAGTASPEDPKAEGIGGYWEHIRPCDCPVCGKNGRLPAHTGHCHIPEHNSTSCTPACLERLGPGEQPPSCALLILICCQIGMLWVWPRQGHHCQS